MDNQFKKDDDLGLFKRLLMRAGRIVVGVDVKLEIKSDVAQRFKAFRKGQEVVICMRGTLVDLKEAGVDKKKNVVSVKATRLIAATPTEGGMILQPTKQVISNVKG